MDVEIRNFQSIDHIKLRIDGYTAMVGRSNIGKSAVIRAITAALSGTSGTNFVRHGSTCQRRTKKAKSCKCYSSVHLRQDGFDLLWEKGDAVNRYTFNGVVYDRADRGTPEFLSPAFDSIQVGTGSVLLQAAPQTKPIFLLDQTGGVVADVLSDVANLDRINVAIRLAEKDKREATATRKVRGQDVIDLEAKQARFVGLDDALIQAKRLETGIIALEKKQGEIGRLDRWVGSVARVEAGVARLGPVETMPTLDAGPIRAKLATYEKLGRFENQLQHDARAVKRLMPVVQVPTLDAAPLRQAWVTYQRLGGWVDSLRQYKAVFQTLDKRAQVATLDATPLRGAWAAYQRTRDWARRLGALQGEIAALEAEEKRLEAEGAEVSAEFAALGVCPTCAKPLHEEAH